MYIRILDQFFKEFVSSHYNNDFLINEFNRLKDVINPNFTSTGSSSKTYFCDVKDLKFSDDFKYKRKSFIEKHGNLMRRKDISEISKRRLEGLKDFSEFSITGLDNILKVAIILAYENPSTIIPVYTSDDIRLYSLIYSKIRKEFSFMISEELINKETITKATDEVVFKAFIEDCCRVADDALCEKSALYEAYVKYHKNHFCGEPLTKIIFGKKFSAYGNFETVRPHISREHYPYCFKGIEINPNKTEGENSLINATKNIEVKVKIFGDGDLRKWSFARNVESPVDVSINLEYDYDLHNINRREFVGLIMGDKVSDVIKLKGLCGEMTPIYIQVYSESKLIDEFICPWWLTACL